MCNINLHRFSVIKTIFHTCLNTAITHECSQCMFKSQFILYFRSLSNYGLVVLFVTGEALINKHTILSFEMHKGLAIMTTLKHIYCDITTTTICYFTCEITYYTNKFQNLTVIYIIIEHKYCIYKNIFQSTTLQFKVVIQYTCRIYTSCSIVLSEVIRSSYY